MQAMHFGFLQSKPRMEHGQGKYNTQDDMNQSVPPYIRRSTQTQTNTTGKILALPTLGVCAMNCLQTHLEAAGVDKILHGP